MNATEAKQLWSSLRMSTINARKNYPLREIKSGQVILDFMTEASEFRHMEVIDFMSSKKMQELMTSKVPSNTKGYVEVFVRKSGKTFDPYGVTFKPYNIIAKFWGLCFSNAIPSDHIFFECLYLNNETKFRGCFRK